MKNKRKSLLFSSLVMLIVATLALSTTSYAWFTTGNTGSVSDFEFTAQTASGILFSVDAENWKSTISASDIQAEVDKTTTTAQKGSKFVTQSAEFAALSTTQDSVVNGVLTLYNSTSDGSKLKTSVETGNTYYVFNIYVNNSANVAKNLALTSLSVTAGSNDKGTQDCVRFAFLDQGGISTTTNATYTTATAIEAAVKALKGAYAAKIIEPNAETHTDYAKTYLIKNEADKTAKLNYSGVKAAGSYDVSDGFIVSSAGGVSEVTTYGASADTVVAQLSANSITKLTVYVWIEGQDIDCNNNVASGNVKANFEFTVAETSYYTVTYAAGEHGTGSVASAKVTPDEEITLPSASSLTADDGYVFKGWSVKIGTAEPEVKEVGDKVKITKDTTITAIWEEAAIYNITYYQNHSDDDTVKYVTTVLKTSTTYTAATLAPTGFVAPDGKQFKNWNTKSDGSGVKVDASSINDISGDVTLYAIWG